MTTDDDLRHDLTLAMHTITETNQSIRFADTKAGALAGVQALMVTVLAAHHETGPGWATQLLRAACLFGVLISTMLLAAGQAPRLPGGRGRQNRVSFPALVGMCADQLLRVPPLQRRHEDAWSQAAALARVAMTKFRWLIRATVSTAVTLVAVLIWLACVN